MTLLLPLLAFLFASLLVGGAALVFTSGGGDTIERRLGEVVDLPPRVLTPEPERESRFVRAMTWLGQAVPKPSSEMGKLRQRLVTAGYRANGAIIVFCGIRVAFAILCFVLAATPIVFRPNLKVALVVALVAYVLPGMVLARLAQRRQHRIRLGLPDVLDLLVVSVEAGLGLDQAIQRVGDELDFAHPDIAEELRLVNIELRAGKPRAEAMRNLADRTGVEDVSSLVAMLVQTDKFGTSVAQSLRVHSETLRTKRRQRAEEAAAKTGVKMVFPLVFCIFPAIWVVTIGPAAIKFVQVLGPMVKK